MLPTKGILLSTGCVTHLYALNAIEQNNATKAQRRKGTQGGTS